MTSSAVGSRTRTVGIALSLGVGAVCVAVGSFLPWFPGLLVAIVLGILARNLRWLPQALTRQVTSATRPILRIGIVILGLQLSLLALVGLGWQGIVVIVVTVATTFGGTLLIGRAMGVPKTTRMLVATGFAICGASAVAAMSSVVDPKLEHEDETAQAIALVTIFGTVTLFVLPLVHGLTHFNEEQMGLWIGASVHEVAQVVASAGAVSAAALAVATVAKLGRVVLLAPLVALVGLTQARSTTGQSRPPIVPLFVIGFIVAMLVRTFLPIPPDVVRAASYISSWLLASAMFGLGLAVDVRGLIATGGRAMVLGTISTVVAVGVSFAVISLTGAGLS